MMQERNGFVYDVTEYENGAVEEKYVSGLRKIALSVDKAIVADGVDKAVITARLQDWQGGNIAESLGVVFRLNGVEVPRITGAAGADSIEFTSLTAGVFPVSCSAPGFDVGTVEVIVSEV